MEKYVDLITNALDLASFLLVTPEIVKWIRPAAWRVAVFAIVVLITQVVALPLLLLVNLDFLPHGSVQWWAAYAFVSLAVFGAIIFWPRAAEWARKLAVLPHLVGFGFVLFFISRLIAFYGSAVKAG